MSVSGFSDKFLFFGFLPKKEKELERELQILSNQEFSQVFFIPPLKINFYLKAFKKIFFRQKINDCERDK